MSLALPLPLFWPDDPVEVLVAVVDVGLQALFLTGDFSAHAGLNVLVAVSFGQSAKSRFAG
jgi:hypothetical protein